MLREGVAFTANALAGPSFNKVAALGPSPPLERLLALAAEFYGDKAGGYGIMVEADAGHPVEAQLRQRGWCVAEDEPALVMAPIPVPPPLPPGLAVRPVLDEAALPVFREVAAAGFEAPADVAQTMAPSEAFARDPEIALLAGSLDGQALGTSACFCLNGVAWIAGVCTLPAYRRRGFGTALTWAALAEGARRGCTAAALNSGPMSLGLYQRMGFVHVCNHRTYAPAAAPQS
jgi:GNAT superfamily N-acetyltransferase